ncbi:hypothetical protein HK100_004578 [Physocladia obscura]|uniref:Uncharacterized protein n=1 Tax=Physocladia obscura TaxID=109957 RepID=A0AAD5SSQ9_9FUNG|nr:hypothetical protein HK100_004578 [Physocladia obscura]
MGLAGVDHMWVIYTLLCIYAVGAVFNGWVLMAIFGDYRLLLQARIDKITTALIATIFVWALGRVLITVLVLFDVVYVFGTAIAAFSNLVVIGLFGLNLLLAIERFIQIKDIRYSNLIYSIFAVIIGVFCVLTVAIFATTVSFALTLSKMKLDRTMFNNSPVLMDSDLRHNLKKQFGSLLLDSLTLLPLDVC